MKKCYVVTFYKTVLSDYGRDTEIRQRAIEVFEDDEASAIEAAKAEFCRQESVGDWSLRANRIVVEQPEFPV